jgi:hypothetical protein
MNIEDNLYFLGNKNQQFNTQIKQHHYYTIMYVQTTGPVDRACRGGLLLERRRRS